MAKAPTKAQIQKAARACGVSTKGTKAEIARRITLFGYNAVEDKGRRQAPQTKVKHESLVLTPKKRKRLQATAQDQVRNLSLVAWMVRKHLDYVAKFHINFRTGKATVDTLVNRIFRWHGAPGNLDISQRFGRDEMFRLFEAEKVVAGDAAFLKLKKLKLQAIESDLIAKANYRGKEKVNSSGLIIDKQAAPLKFCICNRGANGRRVVFDHLEPASNVIFDAYYTRFGSQFRGVSPLSTAINMIQDTHEGFEWNQIKAKMHAIFGIAIMRKTDGTPDFGGAGGATSETASADEQDNDSHLDLDPRTVNILDLNPGEDVKPIESGTPSSEFVDGSYLFIQIAMLALDIPITCFDSRRSSFSARIADLNEYEVSCDSKRTKNRYVRKDYSDWVLASIWKDPRDPWRLKAAAEKAKMNLRDLQEALEWTPSGSPWLDKFKQIQGDQLAIEIGEDNIIDACRRRGQDYFRNIDMQKLALKYAKKQGVPIMVGSTRGKTVEQVIADAVAAGKENEDE